MGVKQEFQLFKSRKKKAAGEEERLKGDASQQEAAARAKPKDEARRFG